VLVTLSLVTTWLFVQVFKLRRAALREVAPRSAPVPRPSPEAALAPGAVLGLVCALLAIPVLAVTLALPSLFGEWAGRQPNDIFIVGILLATSLEASAVLCAVHARGAIDRSRGMLRGKGLTTAALVIAVLNLLFAVALFLLGPSFLAPSFDFSGTRLFPWEK